MPVQSTTIFYAQVDEFNGRLSLNLNTATILQEEGDIAVSGGEAAVTGAPSSISHRAPASSSAARWRAATVPSRARTTARSTRSSRSSCTTCGSRAGLTTGRRPTTSCSSAMSWSPSPGSPLLQAQEIAENNPLGMDEVFLQMRDKVLGRYITCHGREIDGRLLVNKCERVTFDTGEHAALLNRAGGAS